MKGPKLIAQKKLNELYQTIPRFPLSLSERELADYVQVARLDARFAEVITEHIRDYWWKYDQDVLNQQLKQKTSPMAIRPMLAQILELCDASEDVKKDFKKWCAIVLRGIGKAPPQLFFVPSLRPRSKFMDREVLEAREEFRSAGYYSTAILFNKQRPGTIKSYQSDLLSTERKLKLEIYFKLKPLLKGNLREMESILEIDRTTLSKIKSGRIESIGLKRLSYVLDMASRLVQLSGSQI